MAVPNKKIPSVIIISQEFKPCKGCSSPTACKDCATKCWICSSSVTADERCKCVCQDKPPKSSIGGCNWQPAENFPADPTMLAPGSNWERSCEGDCDFTASEISRGNGMVGDHSIESRKAVNAWHKACYSRCSDARIRQWGIGHM